MATAAVAGHGRGIDGQEVEGRGQDQTVGRGPDQTADRGPDPTVGRGPDQNGGPDPNPRTKNRGQDQESGGHTAAVEKIHLRDVKVVPDPILGPNLDPDPNPTILQENHFYYTP